MAGPAIWKPPKFFGTVKGGVQTMPNFRDALGLGAGRTAPAFAGNRAALLGAAGKPQQRSNPAAGILQDYLNQQRADFAADSSADKGGMINALRKYIISYGAAPDFAQLGGVGGDAQGFLKEAMDEKTMGLAAKAEAEGLSSHARLGQQNNKATRFIPEALAARGMLRSGQTGADLGEQAMSYKQAGYDMLNEMLSGITGSVGNFQENERGRQRQLAEAAMNAAMQASQDWGDYDMGGGDDAGPAENLQGTPTKTTKAKPKLYQAMGPYGPYGKAKYTLAQRNKMIKNRKW